MKRQVTTVAVAISLIGALAASGHALAGSVMPASGEGPLFLESDVAASTLMRAEVRADARQSPPTVGERQPASRALPSDSMLTRAEVRAGAIQSPPAGGEQDRMALPASRRSVRAASADALLRDYRPLTGDQG